MASTLLADSSLSDLYAAKNTMSSPAVPSEFGNVVIDMGNQHRSASQITAFIQNSVITNPKECYFQHMRNLFDHLSAELSSA